MLTKKKFKLPVLLCAVIMLMTSLYLPVAAEGGAPEGGAGKLYSVDDVIKPTIKAYSSLSNYTGMEIKTTLKPEDIVDVKVNDHGGVSVDGQGRVVFSNYASLSISLKTEDLSMEIPGTNAKVVSERSYSYAGKHVGRSKKQELKTMIGYGVILTSRADSSGGREISEEFYIRHYGDSLNELRLTRDGDYHIVFLMTVKEGNVRKKIVIEYVIPIRTSTYITDEAGEYHVKNEGAYYGAVRLDAMERPDVRITVNGQIVPDGYMLDGVGVYNIKVYGNGFLCENFDFEIFSKDDEHAYIYLSNARAQLDAISYECENYFAVRWSSNREAYMTYWKDTDSETVYDYSSGDKITEAGTYVFTLHIPALANEEKTFLVNLVEDDDPVVNYNTLHAKRFNNFKTKWYEVYDEAADLYYCFAMNEYVKAYDAAMTLERAKVVDYGLYYTYNYVKYTDKAELTQEINKNATANIKQTYYDPSTEKIEKYFSDLNFDGTVYLNPDFRFVRTSVAETNKVTLISSEGEKTDVAFFTPISTYQLKSGVYTVVEEDKYGNKTEYTCVVDKIAPTAALLVDGKEAGVHDKMAYTGRYFELRALLDDLDAYAVAAVTYEHQDINETTYYYRDECEGVVFFKPGVYTVRLYDRNNNMTRLVFNIVEERQYDLSMTDEGAILKLVGDGVVATSITANGMPLSTSAGVTEWCFEKQTSAVEYLVTTQNTLTGETDYLRFVTEPASSDGQLSEETQGLSSSPANKGEEPMSLDTAIVIISVTTIAALAACAVVLIKMWRRNHA